MSEPGLRASGASSGCSDYIVVGDDEAPPARASGGAEAGPDGELLLRLLPGRPDAHAEFQTRGV